MLKKLILKNFQIHRKLQIDFKEGINTILGSNDSGKSSIIRAIHWLFFNEPNGSWMCRIDRNGKPRTTVVKAVFEDGTIIIRKKGEGINQYMVDDDLYENFGYGVPQQVIEKLKVFPFKTNKETFNVHVAMQDEHPFLVHESGPVKASVLDVLTGNSVLQKSISLFNKDSIRLSNKISDLEQQIIENQNELDSLCWVENIDKVLKEAEKLNTHIQNISEELRFLKDCDTMLCVYDGTISDKIPDISNITTLIEEQSKVQKKLDKLKEYRKQLLGYKEALIEIPDITEVKDLIEKQSKLNEKIGTYLMAQNDLIKYRGNIKNIGLELEEAESELKTFYKQNPNCPSCGKTW